MTTGVASNPQAGQSSFQQCKLLLHVDNMKADMTANFSVFHTSCISQATLLVFRWFDFFFSYWAAGSCDKTHSDLLKLNVNPKPFCCTAGLLTGLALTSHYEEGEGKDQERPKSRTTRERKAHLDLELSVWLHQSLLQESPTAWLMQNPKGQIPQNLRLA